MLNSFSNITRGINDSVIIYERLNSTAPPPDTDPDVATHYTRHLIKLDEGNPNVSDLQKQITEKLKTAGLTDIQFIYSKYNSKFTISVKNISTRSFYINFDNSYELFGFDKDNFYALSSTITNSHVGSTNVNLHSDRLIRFEIADNSDFRLKNMNYCNVLYGSFQDCNIFHLQAVNVLPYDLIYYTRNSDEMIPIELHKNSITDFQINVANQDGDNIEGLSDWIMVLEFTQVKTWNYDVKIYNVLKELYLWIAMFFRNKI
jgi:hypothetical protein